MNTARKKMVLQKLAGIVALVACVIIVIFAANGVKPEDADATPVLFMAPIGLCLLFSKECWL